MEKFVIKGGATLSGNICVGGAKNASLPIMVASLLPDTQVRLKGVPNLEDIRILADLIEGVGGSITRNKNELTIGSAADLNQLVPEEEGGQIRYSLLMLGLLLTKKGKVQIPLPGGCKIGTRKYDLHLDGLRKMGAEIKVEGDFIVGEARKLKGTENEFYYPTFSGTQNIMIAASLADGVTIIRNAARNPEVVDFSNFLIRMGAKIEGVGTSTIKIQGVDKLHGCEHTIMPDRIAVATFMIASAFTNGDIYIENGNIEYLQAEVEKLRNAGVKVQKEETGVRVIGRARPKAVDVTTSAYPGFHTDVQPLFSSLMTIAEGESIIKETILENRFNHLDELKKMGANVEIKEGNFFCVNGKRGRYAIVNGVKKLRGAQVKAHDLRGGAALILAGLAAEGTTKVTDVYQIDRGYEKIEEKLANLGADIRRVAV